MSKSNLNPNKMADKNSFGERIAEQAISEERAASERDARDARCARRVASGCRQAGHGAALVQLVAKRVRCLRTAYGRRSSMGSTRSRRT